jgi:hypothetical protein
MIAGIVAALLVAAPLAAAPPPWQERMTRLSCVMQELLPELAARDGDLQTIERNARELAELSHDLTRGAPPPDADPSLALLAGQLDVDVRHAQHALRHGDVDYAKLLLQSVTGHCIACHTRHDQGPDLPTFTLEPRVEALRPIERAELFASLRQFDRALDECRAILAGDAAQEWLEWEQALHHALAIAVRVKQSPDLAAEIVGLVLAQPAAPPFMKQNAARWAESIARWKAEPQAPPVTVPELRSEMRRLVEEARDYQAYPADRAAEILFLRASATAHELLQHTPEGPQAAEAIHVLGTAHDVMNDPPLWPMHEIYYEACIRAAPHTPIAADCYRRYEDAVHVGYSGSGGLFLPKDVRAKLAQLGRLASP